MRKFNYTITDAQGIHARPAGVVVKTATGFTSKITIAKEGKEVDAKKIFGIMSLGVKSGQEVVIKAEGDDEDSAIEALEAVFKENL